MLSVKKNPCSVSSSVIHSKLAPEMLLIMAASIKLLLVALLILLSAGGLVGTNIYDFFRLIFEIYSAILAIWLESSLNSDTSMVSVTNVHIYDFKKSIIPSKKSERFDFEKTYRTE